MGLLTSGPDPLSADELAAMQATQDAQAQAMSEQKQVTLTGATNLGSGSYDIGGEGYGSGNGGNSYDDISVGQTYTVQTNKDGREYIDIGGAPAYYNESKGVWEGSGHDSAGGNKSGSTFSTGSVTAAPTSSGGGGGKPPPKKKPPTDTMPPAWNPPPGTDPDRSGTNQSLGDQNVESMLGYKPTSSDGEGGTQNLNPLADANNWLHIEDPKYMTPTYSNPPGGQQQQQSGYDVNGMGTMNYSKTGLLSPEEEALQAAGLLG